MKLHRSMLFVPGIKAEWLDKAPMHGADALIIDMEDAVPNHLRTEARQVVAAVLPRLKARRQVLYARICDLTTGQTGKDLAAIVSDSLDGVMLPKVEGPADIATLDALLARIEIDKGVKVGTIEIFPLIETAKGIRNAYEICTASPRVVSVFLGSARGGDVARSLGYVWTEEGTERLYMWSKVLVDARAAGIHCCVTGPVIDIDNLAAVRKEAMLCKQIGYTGFVAIHPRHVPVVNEIFSPTKEELEDCRGILQAIAEGEQQGVSAVRYKGMMIDYAHQKRATDLLQRAKELGLA